MRGLGSSAASTVVVVAAALLYSSHAYIPSQPALLSRNGLQASSSLVGRESLKLRGTQVRVNSATRSSLGSGLRGLSCSTQSDQHSAEDLKPLLGSKRLRKIGQILTKPEELPQDQKLLGSRRLAQTSSTLIKGVQTVDAPLPPQAAVPEEPSAASEKQVDVTDSKDSEIVSESPASATAESVLESETKSLDEAKQEAVTNAAAADASLSQTTEASKELESVMKSIEIEATPEECFAAASGFENYPKWADSVSHVSVKEKDAAGLGTEVEFAVGAFGRAIDYLLQYNYDQPKKMEWKAIAGSVKELIGSYEFEEAPGGKTKVTYKLAIDPGFPLPGMLKKVSSKLIVSTALSDLRKYIEKPETKEVLKLAMSSTTAVSEADAAPSSKDAESDEESSETMTASELQSVEMFIHVDATPEECFAAATGFENYPKWASSVSQVSVKEKDAEGLGTEVEFDVGAFGRNIDYVLQYNYDQPKKMEWKAVEGSVKELIGSYEFEAAPGGVTKVTYKLAIDPGFEATERSSKLIVSSGLSDLRKYVEKPETKEELKLAQKTLTSAGK